MSKIKYINIKFSAAHLLIIEQANEIVEEYQAQGYDLTLRQIYYQFVSRDLISNEMKEYKRLGNIVNKGRLAGLIDWEAIVDRTRTLKSNSHWNNPREIVEACSKQFLTDKWANQKYRVEVWIEKDALIGVIENICVSMDVPYFSCRGYTSQSAMWGAAQRLLHWIKNGQVPIIIHLGDHDPSGIDMTRDISERLDLFRGAVQVKRIALNMNQIAKYTPPPNPAKVTDTRANVYIQKFGYESWELDALEPSVLEALVKKNIEALRDEGVWLKSVRIEQQHKESLAEAAESL